MNAADEIDTGVGFGWHLNRFFAFVRSPCSPWRPPLHLFPVGGEVGVNRSNKASSDGLAASRFNV
jgi:hypothetical protein